MYSINQQIYNVTSRDLTLMTIYLLYICTFIQKMTANTADKSSSIKIMYTQITNTWTYRHNVELINLVLPFQIDMRKCKLNRLLGRDGMIPTLVTI